MTRSELQAAEAHVVDAEKELRALAQRMVEHGRPLPEGLALALESVIEQYLNTLDEVFRVLLRGDHDDTELRALWHRDLHRMRERWPEHFTAPNEHPFIARILSIWDEGGSAFRGPKKNMSPLRQVWDLFRSSFSAEEMKLFITMDILDGSQERSGLPSEAGASFDTYILECIEYLHRRALLPDALKIFSAQRPLKEAQARLILERLEPDGT